MNKKHAVDTGDSWTVRRNLRLATPASGDEAARITEALNSLEGLSGFKIEAGSDRLEVTYNVTKMDYQALGSTLETLDCPLASGGWSRIKGWFYQFSDTNARDNAKAPPPPCCNKPPR
ncbi:hypothetical protein [Thiolapillus sp.]